jgi:ribonuclease P protein 3
MEDAIQFLAGADSEPRTAKRHLSSAALGHKRESNTKDDMSLQRSKSSFENTSVDQKAKKLKKKNINPAILKLRQTVQQCCKIDDLMTAMEVYEQAVADGIKMEAQSFYNLLNLCDGLGDRSIHIGTPKPSIELACNESNEEILDRLRPVDIDDRRKFAFRIKEHMDGLGLPLIETAYTALIKLLSKSRQLGKAEVLLDEAEGVQQCRPKLRMFAPLLSAYCETGSMIPALRVWQRLCRHGLVLSEKEYVALIRCAVITKDACVMDRVLSDLAEDVLVPSRETCLAIRAWFESPAAIATNKEGNHIDDSGIRIVLESIAYPQSGQTLSMGPVLTQKSGWTVSESCSVDTDTGALQSGCLNGHSLKPLTVSSDTWQEMRNMNETIVTSGKLEEHRSQFQGGRKGKRQKMDDRLLQERQNHWTHFQKYLIRRCTQRKIDLVIDGANIGYYEQNFAGAPKHVDYDQINWIVQHFLKQDKSVLLVMHNRHFTSQMMPRSFRPLIQSWLDNDVLYRTPPGMNDDWFWMHAALYAGPGTLVVTNDEMRDHHFQMLARRSFLRWKDRHQVRFSLGAWESFAQGRHQRRVNLIYPEVYSRRIQRVADGLVIPHPKRGDENRFLDGSHVAEEDEPEEETYLSIRPND